MRADALRPILLAAALAGAGLLGAEPAPLPSDPSSVTTARILNPKGDVLILNRPMGLDFDSRGRLFVADLLNRRVRIFEPGQIFPVPETLGTDLLVPWGLAVDGSDRIFLTDTGRNQVLVMAADGAPVTAFGRKGTAPGAFVIPAGVAFDPTRNRYLVADFANHAVQFLDASGTYLGHLGELGRPGRREGQFRGPADVAVDDEGRIYVADKENCRIQIFHGAGGFIAALGHAGSAPGGLDRPSGLTVGPDGAVYVCDTFNHRVVVFEPPLAGALEPVAKVRTILDGRSVPSGGLNLPNKCALSPSGNLYVADTGNNRIVAFPAPLLR